MKRPRKPAALKLVSSNSAEEAASSAKFLAAIRLLPPGGVECVAFLMEFLREHPEVAANPAALGTRQFVQAGDVKGLRVYLRRLTMGVVSQQSGAV